MLDGIGAATLIGSSNGPLEAAFEDLYSFGPQSYFFSSH